MKQKRSIGIVILGIYVILYSMIGFWKALDDYIKFKSINYSDPLFGLMLLIAVIAVLMLKNWGRISMIILLIYDSYVEISRAIQDFNKDIQEFSLQFTSLPKEVIVIMMYLGYLFLILMNIFIIIYFIRPRVKEQFKK